MTEEKESPEDAYMRLRRDWERLVAAKNAAYADLTAAWKQIKPENRSKVGTDCCAEFH